MIKPFAHSITVSDPPAEEEKRSSGLVVVGDVEVAHARGIVMEVAPGCPQMEHLNPGDVVFYKKGCCAKIGDLRVVPEEYVIAYEPNEAL